MAASKVTPSTITATKRHPKDRFLLFGQRVPWGEDRTVYEVDGFVFPDQKTAEAFAASDWPREIADGRYATSETPPRIFTNKDKASARQANIDAIAAAEAAAEGKGS